MTQPYDKQNLGAARIAARATASTKRRRKEKAAGLSVLSNTLLVLLKLVVGVGFGSVSVLSEAIHSATDLLAAAFAFLSVRVSDTPPDADHPYGHGKVENLSGLVEAILIYIAAGFIIFEAIRKLSSHDASATEVRPALLVMAVSAAVNSLLSTHLGRVARATDSQALEADARHLRTDVLTSLGVFSGLLLVRLTGHAWFDPVTALLVALLILTTAMKLTRDVLHPLMDASLPAEEELAIHQILDADTRVMGYHKLRTRKSGSQRHADVHVQIDDDCTLVQAHDLTEELEDQIRDALPEININIHIEPYYAEMQHQREVHGMTEPLLSESQRAESQRAESQRGKDADVGLHMAAPAESRPAADSSEPHTGAH